MEHRLCKSCAAVEILTPVFDGTDLCDLCTLIEPDPKLLTAFQVRKKFPAPPGWHRNDWLKQWEHCDGQVITDQRLEVHRSGLDQLRRALR